MIIAIDTETGGLDPRKSALLSISACQLQYPDKKFNVFILPESGLEIHPKAAEVNGYTPELWKERGAIPLLEALRRFKTWLPFAGNGPLAHNAPFDKSFIEAAEERAGFNLFLQKRWRCSMALFMGVNDALNLNAMNFQLATLARMSGVWGEGFKRGAHQSLDDVVACAKGWNWLIEKVKAGAVPVNV